MSLETPSSAPEPRAASATRPPEASRDGADGSGVADGSGIESDAFSLQLQAVEGTGERGRAWAARFRSSSAYAQLETIFFAMRRFRGYDATAAGEALDRVAPVLAAEPGAEADAGHHLARRWYLSARAYQEYLEGDLEAAEACMDEARTAAVEALSRHRFLLPFATQFTDFDIQKARIARHGNRWDAVRHHLARVRAMLASREPLCVLNDGTAWTLDDLLECLERTLPEGEHKRRTLANLADPATADRLEESLCTLPDFVIPYP